MLNRLVPPMLRRPLGVFLLCLATALVAASLSREMRSRAALKHREAMQSWQAARHDLDQLPGQLALVGRSAALHRALAARGFLGEEKRLHWVSALARTQSAMHLDSLDWRLEPRAADHAVAGLGASRMHVRAHPLDVDRLPVFLDSLSRQAQGAFTVEQCTLTLGNAQGQPMECTLAWWTWNPPHHTP